MNMFHINVDGYQYVTYREDDGDCYKFFHECWKNGNEVNMTGKFYRHSPYSIMKPGEFAEYINDIKKG